MYLAWYKVHEGTGAGNISAAVTGLQVCCFKIWNIYGFTVLHTKSFTEFHIDWYSPTEVYLYSEAKSSKLVRTFTQRLGFQKCECTYSASYNLMFKNFIGRGHLGDLNGEEH